MRWLRRLYEWNEQRQARHRGLFAYRDGARLRYGDPAVIWRKLLNHPKYEFANVVQLATVGQEPEYSQLLEIVSDAFGVQRWDEAEQTGLTEWGLVGLLQQFDEYLTALKKNTSPSLMPWQLSAYGGQSSLSAQTPGEAADGPTSFSADSSSTSSELSTDEVTPSSDPLPTA